MQFRVLGPLEVLENGRRVMVGGGIPRRILGVLLSQANRVVSSGSLIEAVWDGSPPPSAAKTLQSHLVRLRAAVDPDRRMIRTRPPGYVLTIEATDLDALRFEQLIARGRRARSAGALESAAAMFAAGLELWDGAAYADLRACDLLAQEAVRLDELRLAAREERIGVELALGHAADLITELETLTLDEPFREALWCQLAVALYRTGRQAEALAALARLRGLLRDELAVDPGAEVDRLEQAILTHDPGLHPTIAGHEGGAAHRHGAALPPRLAELADDSWPFTGREADLAWLDRAWSGAARSSGALVLIVGDAGSGRSRLVAQFADGLACGVRILYAAGGRPAELLATALQGAGADLVADTDEPALATTLTAAGEELPTLVVLDDLVLGPGADKVIAMMTQTVQSLPVLVVVVVAGSATIPAVAELDPGGGRIRGLGPLDRAAVAAIVDHTARASDRAVVQRAAETAAGRPSDVRREVTAALERLARQRVDVAAQHVHDTRGRLRPARADVASGVLELRSARDQRVAASRTFPIDEGGCPYKGLNCYDVADAAYFVGREQLTAELIARLAESDLLVLVGASGSGKSSVARAGVLAALADGVLPDSDRWGRATMLPGPDPAAELDRVVPDLAGPSGVILVDQGEELFTTCCDDQRRADFIDQLLALPERGIRVVLTLRADFFGACAAYPALADAVSNNSVLVGPLTERDLRRVIEVPARRAGSQVDDALPHLVAGEVSGRPEALPLLSTALLRAWQCRRDGMLSTKDYQAGGGITRAVEELGEAAYRQLDPAAAAACRRILLRLADPGPTEDTLVRRRAPRDEIADPADDAAGRALGTLIDQRLVTIDADHVEVTHEALFDAWPRLKGWLNDDAAGRQLVRHLTQAAHDWWTAGREPSELYRGVRLQAALDWASVHGTDLTPLEREFLQAGSAEADRQRREAEQRLASEQRGRRRARRVAVTLGVVLVLALTAAVVAVDARRQAQRASAGSAQAAVVADARRLGALGVITPDLDRAVLLAAQAVRMDDSADTRGNLLAALLRSPSALAVVRPPGGYQQLALDLSPDGRSLAVGDSAGQLSLVDTGTRQMQLLAARLGGEDERIWLTEFSPDGRSVAVLRFHDRNSAVEIWDLRTRAVTRLPDAVNVVSIAWSPRGRRLVMARVDQDAAVVDIDDPLLRKVLLSGSAGQGFASLGWVGTDKIAIKPDGQPLGVWDAATGRRIGRRALDQPNRSLAVSPDGHTLAVGMAKSEIWLYDSQTLRRTATLAGHRAAVFDLSFSADGRSLASAGDDREVLIWDVRRRSLVERLAGHAGRVTQVIWSRAGDILWTASQDGTLIQWDVAGARRLDRRLAPPTDDGAEWYSFDRSGDRVAAGDDRGVARVWSLTTSGWVGPPIRTGSGLLPAVGLSPDGTLLITCGWDGRAQVYRTDGHLVGSIPGLPHKPVLDASFSPDGRTVAISADDGVHLIDVTTLRPNGPPLRPDAPAWATVWSPDGKTVLLTSQFTHTVSVWSVTDRHRLATLTPSTSPTLTAAYTPDQRLVVTGDTDGQIRFWDPTTWRQIGTPTSMGAGMILSASVSADGRMLVTGADDGTVRLLDLTSHKPLGPPLPGVDNKRAFAHWAPRQQVVTGFGNGSIRSYDLDPASWLRRACTIAGRQLTNDEWDAALPGRPYQRTCP